MDPQITAGICVKNAQSTVAETIESILAQDYRPDLVEIVVVDGNSKDATLSIVQGLLSRGRVRWRLYSDGGKGLGYARQTVANHARGKYLLFVDSDVVIRNDFLREQIGFLNTHPEVGVGQGRYMYKEGGGLLSSTWNLYLSTSPSFIGCAFTFRKDAVRDANGFDEKIRGAGEEVDLIARIRSKGWESAVTEGAKFYHNHRWTLRSFWSEHNWFGRGGYHVKDRRLLSTSRNLPPGQLLHGLRIAPKTYRLTRRKISFLIVPLLVFGSIAWCVGFVQAAIHR
jgi:glycosyltransferase involved in cell wall biosynthesis